MIVKNIIDNCSVFNVAKTIAYWAKVDEKDFPALFERCTRIINEMKNLKNFWTNSNKNFCFIGYRVDNEVMPRVILTDLDKMEENNFDVKAVTPFDWYWDVIPGLTIHKESVDTYSGDMLLGRILYRVTYYDYTEAEISPLRKFFEETNDITKMSQAEFYIKLHNSVWAWEEENSK